MAAFRGAARFQLREALIAYHRERSPASSSSGSPASARSSSKTHGSARARNVQGEFVKIRQASELIGDNWPWASGSTVVSGRAAARSASGLDRAAPDLPRTSCSTRSGLDHLHENAAWALNLKVSVVDGSQLHDDWHRGSRSRASPIFRSCFRIANGASQIHVASVSS